ncbi:GNAT family N-acetyltransferase [Bradyrhizobium sp. CCGB12]|uniref:GNAT family N-acetyltransferase n=1 Tax=Bradyrhizobium sp. CCGB12 TaxID=2949632 RepID=UPI0020B187DE|nr:GNAT family N-acetyltransferase [Bradyrhizobium sp. CCGB12]MCP3388855.1 GNAT family N-acetyltransferase [Bradyrhizobium sp. CCGB12]
MPGKKITIRRAAADDARAVHDIVLRALCETNAKDYPASVIDRLVLTLPDKVAASLETWHAFTAFVDGRVVGTASLSGHVVKSVFVHPDFQRRGVATRLMAAVESAAIGKSVPTLDVQSSITAQPFYAKWGFTVVREEFYGEERTIVMSKAILPAPE